MAKRYGLPYMGSVRIASRGIRSIKSSSGNSTIKTEGLFVQERFAGMFD